MHKINNKVEMLLWSIAFPGFGQLLNGKLVKGIVLLILEFLINTNGNINLAIIASFYGEIHKAIELVNYEWLMFYPCVYVFAIWDSYSDVGEDPPFTYLPFVFAAYFGTIGVIYSPTFTMKGVILGPIWAPILYMLIGITLGLFLKKVVNKIIVN